MFCNKTYIDSLLNGSGSTKNGVLLDQGVIEKVLYDIYQKANHNEIFLAEQMIGEIVGKLQPFFVNEEASNKS